MSGHTDFQIDNFIINKGNWTPEGQLKQVEREIRSRTTAIQEMECEIESKELEVRRTQLAIQSLRESIDTANRELERFKEHRDSLESSEGSDEETWLVRIQVMLAVDLICQGRPSPNVVNLLLSTPQKFRQNVIENVAGTLSQIRSGDIGVALETTCRLINEKPDADAASGRTSST